MLNYIDYVHMKTAIGRMLQRPIMLRCNNEFNGIRPGNTSDSPFVSMRKGSYAMGIKQVATTLVFSAVVVFLGAVIIGAF